jgi:acetamidase/formamidase
MLIPLILMMAAADVSGPWEFILRGGQITEASRVQLSFKDNQYAFSMSGMDCRGPAEGDRIRFTCTENGHPCCELTATFTGQTMTGTGKIDGLPMEWSGQRPAARPGSGPARHEFTPTAFYRHFSSAPAPALRIFPGDTVHTTTVDAGGRDGAGEKRVFGGNPLTGPFYIEGAMPGDVVSVKLTRVRLNRDSANSGAQVVPSALDPRTFRDQPKVDKFDSEWALDRSASVGRLKNPTPKLKNFSIPLKPMVGCIGVAPPNQQSFRAGDLGDWGGNLDYNQIVEGVTVFLPVYAPGALLYVGDGHAAQGDGELTGDALETSLELEFTVDLQRNVRLGQARIESDEFVMFSGVANSLGEALQRATSGMSRYLASVHGLNPAEAGIVMGSAMKYDIAEIVDPRVHVVAKLPRKVLATLAAQ